MILCSRQYLDKRVHSIMKSTPIDTMKSKLNKGITMVTVKTNSSVEKAKINTHMETVHKEMERLKQELGNKVFILWEADNFDMDKVQADLEQIREKKDTLKELQMQLDAIDEQANAILGSAENAAPPMQDVCFCANCGSRYEQKINFCVKCGNQIGQ